jgi:hypothetical protein
MSKQQKTNEQGGTPAEISTGVITAETRVIDFLPEDLLEDIRTLQAIHDRLAAYKEKKDADPGIWPTFSEDADSAMDHIMNAIYDMSSIAGKELDFHILNF